MVRLQNYYTDANTLENGTNNNASMPVTTAISGLLCTGPGPGEEEQREQRRKYTVGILGLISVNNIHNKYMKYNNAASSSEGESENEGPVRAGEGVPGADRALERGDRGPTTSSDTSGKVPHSTSRVML